MVFMDYIGACVADIFNSDPPTHDYYIDMSGRMRFLANKEDDEMAKSIYKPSIEESYDKIAAHNETCKKANRKSLEPYPDNRQDYCTSGDYDTPKSKGAWDCMFGSLGPSLAREALERDRNPVNLYPGYRTAGVSDFVGDPVVRDDGIYNNAPELRGEDGIPIGQFGAQEDSLDNSIGGVLASRGAKYGRFMDHAQLTQDIKYAIFNHKDRGQMPPDMAEALEMIAHKIGRIVCGDHNYDDSWVDIAGYAKLIADRLQGK